MSTRTRELLEFIYEAGATEIDSKLEALMNRYREQLKPPDGYTAGELPLDETSAIMISYGDGFRGPDGVPLSYLLRFLDDEAEGVVSGVHILPFAPYSSDDGFSVIDYREVNPALGGWDDIQAIGEEFVLVADLVLNHCSVQGPWFKGFLANEAPYKDYFVTVPEGTDVSSVVRPRTHPLLTPFETAAGKRWVWTTFSADQADLDYANPDVMLEMLDVFLGYVAHGARVIREDAIAYMWKELGTPCLHHPKTHAMVQLMRAVVDVVCPWVIIITETNVPHPENISYFGDGTNEAHMIYNFSLPPLTLDAFMREDSNHLQKWAASLDVGAPMTSFFNFTASHDGVGLLPAHGILSDDEIAAMAAKVEERGGKISYKATAAGKIPYEMNVNYMDAITEPSLPDDQRARMFLASQSILLALAGVPGIYYHSLVGSENWQAGVKETGQNRTINREKLDFDKLSEELSTDGSRRNLVFEGYKILLRARSISPAFHPSAGQKIVATPKEFFCILRIDRDEEERVLCLVNIGSETASVSFAYDEIDLADEKGFHDLISGDYVYPSMDDGNRISLELQPYEVLWLKY